MRKNNRQKKIYRLSQNENYLLVVVLLILVIWLLFSRFHYFIESLIVIIHLI